MCHSYTYTSGAIDRTFQIHLNFSLFQMHLTAQLSLSIVARKTFKKKKLIKFSLLKTLVWKHSLTEKGNTNFEHSHITDYRSYDEQCELRTCIFMKHCHINEPCSANSLQSIKIKHLVSNYNHSKTT